MQPQKISYKRRWRASDCAEIKHHRQLQETFHEARLLAQRNPDQHSPSQLCLNGDNAVVRFRRRDSARIIDPQATLFCASTKAMVRGCGLIKL